MFGLKRKKIIQNEDLIREIPIYNEENTIIYFTQSYEFSLRKNEVKSDEDEYNKEIFEKFQNGKQKEQKKVNVEQNKKSNDDELYDKLDEAN